MENILEKITQTSLKLLEPLSSSEMYNVITEEAVRLTSGIGSIIHLEKNNNLDWVYASKGVINVTKARKRGFTYIAYKKNKLTILDTKTLTQVHPLLVENGVKQAVLIPLSYKGKSIGVITSQLKEQKEFSPHELNGLNLFGSLASLAIKKTQLYDEQKKSLEIRDLFISLASHELRTPLTSINGYIQLLYSKLGKQDTNEGKWIRELSDESSRMTNLVKELLEINRIKQGQFQFIFSEVSFKDIVQKTIERIIRLHSEREFQFTNKLLKDSDKIVGDSEKLLQMTSEMIENAVKFSPATSIIEIIIRNTKKDVILLIKDKGVGIKDEDINRILEGFYKGSQQEKEGMGVGLVMARHIIQAHHGDIAIHSKPLKGTEVTVTLPRAK